PGAVEGGDRPVATARLRRPKLLLHGEAAPPALHSHLLAGEEGIERDRRHLRPHAAGRAKVRDAALGRDARTCKRDDDRSLINEESQLSDRRFKVRSDHASTRPVRPSFAPVILWMDIPHRHAGGTKSVLLPADAERPARSGRPAGLAAALRRVTHRKVLELRTGLQRLPQPHRLCAAAGPGIAMGIAELDRNLFALARMRLTGRLAAATRRIAGAALQAL